MDRLVEIAEKYEIMLKHIVLFKLKSFFFNKNFTEKNLLAGL